jgi:4-carboxymuconolactone decarboxylase
MSKLGEKSERGAAVLGEMMGPAFAEKMRENATSGQFGADISRMALDYSFADSWGREGLPKREKSLVVIAALIAMKQPAELRNHVKIGVANGLTVADFESLLVQLASYVGFPCIASAQTAVIEALREAGHDPNVKTSEERGLL